MYIVKKNCKSVAHSLILIRAKFSVASKFINVYRSVIVLYTWVYLVHN